MRSSAHAARSQQAKTRWEFLILRNYNFLSKKTGVFIGEENAHRLTMNYLIAFEAAIDEYFSALDQSIQ